MKELILAMANYYLLPEFEDIDGVQNLEFKIEGWNTKYPKLRLHGKVDIKTSNNPTEEELNEKVKEWVEISDKVSERAREIEKEIGGRMIWTFVDRAR